MSIVEFKDFSFRYLRSKKPALQNVNLSIDAGTVVGIIGRAGAGKTTLLKSLNGLVPHIEPGYQEGKVIVNGRDIRESDVSEMAHLVSIVLENPETQIFSLTVEDDVAFGPANLSVPSEEIWERVRHALKETELEGFESRNPNNLSGGEQQSLAVAGSLAMRPRVLALDEPVAMLDPVGKEQVMAVIERITRGDSQTTTVITESGADIEALADKLDRVIVLHEGKIIEDGPVDVLMSPVLDEIGVGRPQVTRLFTRLQNAGVAVPRIPVTLSDAIEITREMLTAAGIQHIELSPGYGQPKRHTFGEQIIEVENLEHVYPPNVRALRGVSLAVRAREIIGVIGQNGSGKTTLARHLVGLLKPSNRDAIVRVMGKNVTKMKIREIIKMINYVFQNPDDQIFADTVWDEVAFAPMMMDMTPEESKPIVEKALETFNLTGHERDYTMSLPEDLKTYLSIACVLPLGPEILLIDEPTTGLDTRGEKIMMASLETLREAGHTIIIITHNMKTVAEHCDRTFVMKQGKIIMEGTPREIYAQTEKLLEADIKPPQITQLGQALSDFGFPRDVLSVDEMTDLLLHDLGNERSVR